MNETSTTVGYGLTSTTAGYSQTINGGTGIFTNPNNTTITTTYSHLNLTPVGNMRPTQAKVAVFTITRDSDTNEINSTKFVKELWVERKNGTSIDLIVAKQLDVDFDPETTVIKEITTISF